MNRKTLTSLGVLAVLSIIAIVVLRRPQTGERRGDRPRAVARLNPGDFDTIAVTKAKATTVIKKDGAKYNVTSPTPYPADESVAKAAFEALEKLEFGTVVTEQKAKHAEFEVGDDALRVAAKKGDKVLAELIVGKSLGSGTMVRAPGKDDVWSATGSFKYSFDKNASDWRDKSITTFTPADAEKIDLTSKTGGTATLKKADKAAADKDKPAAPAGDEAWTVAASTLPIPTLDANVPTGLIAAMSSWKTNDFADGVKPEETGLAEPTLTVTVSLKGGKTATALIGNKKGDDDYYVKTPESPQVFLVKRYNIDRINKRPIELRDKTLCDIADGDLTDVSVTRGAADSYALNKPAGKDWRATKPAKLELDPAKVTPIAGAFKAWKATSFSEDPSPAATGLVKPKATIAAKSKSASCAVKIGDETKDKQSYFAQVGAGPDVYLVPKWSVDRILVKVDDLKKSAVAAAPSAHK